MFDQDVELRLIRPSKNRFRVYGLTVCRTLFGEIVLRVVWGRVGNRPLQARDERFESEEGLELRWRELLEQRRKHGYVPLGVEWAQLLKEQPAPTTPALAGTGAAREIVESHGLSLRDRQARRLVQRWHAATNELRRYVREHGQPELDLSDVSTLAEMYVTAAQA